MDANQPLLPTSSGTNIKDGATSSPSIFRISIARLLLIGFALPPISLAYFLAVTIVTDFDDSTYTHCKVLNVIPSLSAVARSQQFGWRLCTWLHFPYRLLAVRLYWRYYRLKLPRQVRSFGTLAVWFLLQESLSCVALALGAHIDGNENLHLMTAISLWLSGFFFMAISYASFKYYLRVPLEPLEQESFQIKRKCIYIYFGSVIIMWICYMLHMGLCLPLAYSVFAICEYITCWCLMGFLWTSYLDFYHIYLCYNPLLGDLYLIEGWTTK